MVNSTDFSKRLQKVMDFYSLSASAFADKVGVQRSSISHILSGRNKPSLEFVMKVLSSFNDVDLYWLLNGKGKFPSEVEDEIEIEAEHDVKNTASPIQSKSKLPHKGKAIERIVIFFKDGSFKSYDS